MCIRDRNNTISTIAAPSAALTINGRGSLSVSNLNCGALNVLGGSAKIPEVPSLNGRKRYVFNATGTNAAIVDGKGFQYMQPSPDGKAYLWLPEPGVDLSSVSYTHLDVYKRQALCCSIKRGKNGVLGGG